MKRGPDSLYMFRMHGLMESIRDALTDHGIRYRTLISLEGGARAVVVLDSGSETRNNAAAPAEAHHVERVEQKSGYGSFIGGDTREEGHRAYRDITNRRRPAKAYLRRHDGGRRVAGRGPD